MTGPSSDESPRILIVDDDESIREVMGEFLAEAGMSVEKAADGDEAIETFKRQRPDIVLLDVMMPGMDGYETCSALKRLPGAEYVPVVMVTALDDTDSIERAYQVGASNFITKPINWPNLPHQVQYALRSSRAFADLSKSEERYALAARGANDGLWDWDLEADEVHFSPRWKSMLGYADDEVGTGTEEWFERIHPKDRRQLEAAIKGHLLDNATPHLEVEHRIRAADGAYRWVLCRGVAIHDSHGKPSRMAGSQTDITARKRAEERLLFDGLTGLPNRSLFMDRVSHRLQLSRQKEDDLFAVLLMDLDRINIVNESLGHAVGDELLRGVSERLKSCLSETDTLARLGGDEFTVLLEEVPDVAAVTRFVERVQAALKEPLELEGHQVVATASIGIAFSSTGYERPEEMLRDADVAAHRAKSLGKDRYEIFDQGMHANAMRALRLEIALRQAVQRKEFELVYQPMVALDTDTLTGFEALLRWRHPKLGLILPEKFLWVAEEAGLIVPMGRWVMQEACRQMRVWQEHWPAAKEWFVSVNVSGRELAEADFLEQVDGTLASSGLSPGNLTLEVTERTLLENTEHAQAILAQAQQRGIQIAIDDFGIGYSSFSHLHQFPFALLKIDHSFVTNLETNNKNLEIVKAIIALAHSLGMKVVAEGSEKRQDVLKLRQMACEMGQGHVFAQPLVGDAVDGLIAQKLGKNAEAS